VSNGTLALDASLKSLGIGPGDEVIVTPRTFIASISCVVNAGATPVFADVEADSGNISAATITEVLTPRTKAVICVHLAGWPCDMDPIMALAESQGFKVIEDCAQAHGAKYKGRCVGSIGHVGAWSFCQDKIMSTGGEGGMVTTNDKALWRDIWSYRDHGKNYEAVFEREWPPGYRWVHEGFGTNFRMLEMQATIGRIQLRRMADWTAQRRVNTELIWKTCGQHSVVRVPPLPISSSHAYYKCYIYVRPENLAPDWNRDRIIETITSQGVPCYPGACSEVYLEKAFNETGWCPPVRLPMAKELGETSLMFLVHPTLNQSEIDKTCQVLNSVLQLATK
jgi:dTDP-4-amino-4,6-dideoxygalactose transaminase